MLGYHIEFKHRSRVHVRNSWLGQETKYIGKVSIPKNIYIHLVLLAECIYIS